MPLGDSAHLLEDVQAAHSASGFSGTFSKNPLKPLVLVVGVVRYPQPAGAADG